MGDDPHEAARRSAAAPDVDCLACGACCTLFQVQVEPEDPTPRRLTRSVRRIVGFASWEADAGIPCMKTDVDGRCVALEGTVGRAVACACYGRRPTVCRGFTPGSEACREARSHAMPGGQPGQAVGSPSGEDNCETQKLVRTA